MTTNLSSSSRFLTGLALLSVGLAAISLYSLVAYRKAKRRDVEVGRTIGSVAVGSFESNLGEFDVVSLTHRLQRLAENIDWGRRRDDFHSTIEEAQHFLGNLSSLIKELESVYRAALQASIDQLVHLDAEEERTIVALIEFFSARNRLEASLSRGQWWVR